jgi:hypothetical protein
MKPLFIILFACISLHIQSQELFVVTEPASNMPAKSFGIRNMSTLMFERNNTANYHSMPELMFGVNKNTMIHVQGFFSTRQFGEIETEGASLYAKYRFLSVDDIKSHFRMAVYGRYSFNRADIHQQEIETMGHNTGYEIGLVATQLLHKVALSSSVSFEKALDNKPKYIFPTHQDNEALNYSFSVGKLMLPKTYKSYKQINLNLMLETLGQVLMPSKKSFLDIVPSAQLIINSQLRLDFGYRYQLYSNMQRTAPNGLIFKVEYTWFNVF